MKYSIQTLNKISKAGTDRFCDAYTISDDAKDPDAILEIGRASCRERV